MLTKGTSQELDRGTEGRKKHEVTEIGEEFQSRRETETNMQKDREGSRSRERLAHLPTCPPLSLTVQVELTFQPSASFSHLPTSPSLQRVEIQETCPQGLLTTLSASD